MIAALYRADHLDYGRDEELNKKLKNIFLTGLVVVIPVGVSLYILIFIIRMMDSLLLIIPEPYQPDRILPFHIPGLGVIATIITIFVAGLVTKSYIGNKFVLAGEGLVDRIPIIRSIYQAVKHIADGIIMNKGRSFRNVVLVEYPRKGTYAVGFVTGTPGEIQDKVFPDRKCIGVFLPMALTPTTGFFMIIPESDVTYLKMTIEEAFTLIISGGVVTPQLDGYIQRVDNGQAKF